MALTPLSPREVSEDQVKMWVKRDHERKEERKKTRMEEKNSKKGKKKNDKSEKYKSDKSLFLREKEVKNAVVTQQPLYLLMSNNICLSSTQVSLSLGLEKLLRAMRMSFLKTFHMVCLLKKELKVTWISFQVQQFLIGQPIEVI